MTNVFGVLCLIFASIGTWLTVLSGNLLDESLPSDAPTWKNAAALLSQTLDDAIARGQRVKNRRIGAIVSKVGLTSLYLSTITGLLIGFPDPCLSEMGLAAIFLCMVYMVVLLCGVDDIKRRIHLFNGMQELSHMKHGNVVPQNATADLETIFASSKDDIKKSEKLLEKLLRMEREAIEERRSRNQPSGEV
jgi:hypothetical protein